METNQLEAIRLLRQLLNELERLNLMWDEIERWSQENLQPIEK